jgi:hypothetical protein
MVPSLVKVIAETLRVPMLVMVPGTWFVKVVADPEKVTVVEGVVMLKAALLA